MVSKIKDVYINFRVKAADKILLESKSQDLGYQDLSEYIRDKVLDNSNEKRGLNNAQIHMLSEVLIGAMCDVRYLANEFLRYKHQSKSEKETADIFNNWVEKSSNETASLMEILEKTK